MSRSKIFWGAGFALAFALTFGARSASADLVYDLTTGNSPAGLSGFPGPFAEITVHLVDSTHATLTYQALSQGAYDYRFGHAQAIDFNLNPNHVANVSVTTDVATLDTTPTSGQVDGFGNFNFTIDNQDGASDVFTHVVVSLALSNGDTFSSVSDILSGNNLGNILAAGMFAFDAGTTHVASTGFADGAVLVSGVPEPSTMAIAGLGALGFVGYSLRRRVKK